MRLFIAVDFERDEKRQFAEIRNELKAQAESGNFTREENFHLTVVFLGEVPGSQVTVIENIMEEIEEEPFDLEFKKVGCFRKKAQGDIWWMGCEKSKPLTRIYRQLSERLSQEGFNIEKRGFKPHITLGRSVVMKSSYVFGEAERTVSTEVGQLTLMLSERMNGRLTYTPIYEKPLWYK